MRSARDKDWDDDIDIYAYEHQRAWCDWEYLHELAQGGDPQYDTNEQFCDAIGMDLEEYQNMIHKIYKRRQKRFKARKCKSLV